MKHILFLDDDRRRTDEIRRHMQPQPCELFTVETVGECIAALEERHYDLVMLDHDLAGETFVDSSRDDCGMEVVRWLKINGGAHRGFIIHTMNAVAAATMYFELTAMGYPVEQASFGSPEFFGKLFAMLGLDNPLDRPAKRTLGKRVGRYFKGLRGGR